MAKKKKQSKEERSLDRICDLTLPNVARAGCSYLRPTSKIDLDGEIASIKACDWLNQLLKVLYMPNFQNTLCKSALAGFVCLASMVVRSLQLLSRIATIATKTVS